MSGLPPSEPIPVAPHSTSHHVRSLSYSFGSGAGPGPSTSPSSSTFSPITPSPILAGLDGAKSSFFSTSPRAPFSKDWASSWASGGIGGGASGSAVAEDDEDGGPLSMSTSLGGGSGGGGGPGIPTRSLGWGGAVVAGAPGNGSAVVMGGPQTGTRTVIQPEGANKMNGVLRRLSLGGAGVRRPTLQMPPPTPQTPLPTPQAPAGSFFPPSVTAVPDLMPDRAAGQDIKPRGRKPSVGGRGKRSISPTGERMLQGHHGGLF